MIQFYITKFFIWKFYYNHVEGLKNGIWDQKFILEITYNNWVKKMLVQNQVCYSRKKQRRLHEKELKTGVKTATFKKRRKDKYKFTGFSEDKVIEFD